MTATFADHGGHFNGPGFNYLDLNAVDTGKQKVGLDHLITNSGTVLVRVNGTPLSELGREPERHDQYDETGGVPASGF